MSNALYGPVLAVATSAPAAAAHAQSAPLAFGAAAVGVWVLLAWVILRVARPQKLSLRHTPGRPNRLTGMHLLAVVLVMLAARPLAGRIASVWLHTSGPMWLVVVASCVELATLAAALVAAKSAFPLGLRRGLGLSGRHWLFDSGRALVAFLAVWPVCLALLVAFQWAAPPGHKQHAMLLAIGKLGGLWRAGAIVLAVVVAPISEEVLFRGLVQSAIRRYTRQPWLAVVFTALIFAAVHQPYYHMMPALFALAIALGYNYERSGRLWAPILLHATFNAFNVVAFLTRSR